MARLNVSLSNELASRITDEAGRMGKTVSSLITEAAVQYIELKEQGLDIGSIHDFLTYFNIITSTRSVPVPFRLFDDMLDISMNRSDEKPLKLFYETGLVIGNLLKNYAQDMESLSRLSEKLKIKLPLDDLRFHRNKDLWEATVSGAGYGQSSSECLASGLKGFLEAYQMKIKSVEVMAGFVRATFQ